MARGLKGPKNASYGIKKIFLEKPSPLGLQLKKSPSFLNLIGELLSQANSSTNSTTSCKNLETGIKDLNSAAFSGTVEKLKASNFPASLLRIGSWELVSRREGDLVAKFYFAKKKIVWEVLDGSLKSKLEMQWSEITTLKANLPEDGPGTLDIVLAKPPRFFKETNPQPRKHTLWQATSDFTGGEASRHRRHILQCPRGLLNDHFEKLILRVPHFHTLSQDHEIVLENPYCELHSSPFGGQDGSKDHDSGNLDDCYRPSISEYNNHASSSAVPSVSTKHEFGEYIYRMRDNMVWEDPQCSSDSASIHGQQMIQGNSPLHSGSNPANTESVEDLRNYLQSSLQATCESEARRLVSVFLSLRRILNMDPATMPGLEPYSFPTPFGDVGQPWLIQGLHPAEPLLDASWLSRAPAGSSGNLVLHHPGVAEMPQFSMSRKKPAGESPDHRFVSAVQDAEGRGS